MVYRQTKEHVFFEQWKVQFAEVHGSLEQKKIDKETLFTSYGFSKNEQKDFNVLAFFFALDSYYALLMKLLSYQVVGYYTLSKLTGLPLHDWETFANDDLRRKCNELEEGGIFRSIGIRNFLEGDLFSWYIEAWNEKIYQAIQQIIKYLNNYDPETMEIAPDETRDILKKLYQYLVPKQIRHDLGEYYTPDWLAERCLNQLNYNGDSSLRILDPACGSGTFPILAIKRAKEFARKKNIEEGETLKRILHNIQGFDLNPLAVTSARTNYMMAIADLLKFKRGEITIPIYLCDSINPPQARIAHEKTLFAEKTPYEVKTSVGNFYFSHSIISKKRIQQLANLMEDGVKSGQSPKDLLKKIKRELQLTPEELQESEIYLIKTYENLVELERKGINGVWARIIKNAFAPLFVGDFDMIVGNPPWVNWEALPQTYRDQLTGLFQQYGLVSHKGQLDRMRGGKKDISMLMTYVAIDKYLKEKGKLCFVITQTLFKTEGAGDGFRRFRVGDTDIYFRIIQVDDMVELQPFEGATNRTAVFILIKGEQTNYPLPYTLWRKLKKGSISQDLNFKEVFEMTKRLNLAAKPIGKSMTSPWVTARSKALNLFDKITGDSYYAAREGSNTGGANGIYWIDVLDKNGNQILARNLNEIGKKQFPIYSQWVESDLVYPLVRGRDISRWKGEASIFLILPQDKMKQREGIDEKTLYNKYPLTYQYLKQFEDMLSKRADRKYYPEGSPFYTMRNVAEYTFAPYKVVWSEVGYDLETAVISSHNNEQLGETIVVPDHTVVAVSVDNESEAHYVCAVLNSTPAQFVIRGYVVLHPSPHVLKNIRIPKYDKANESHARLSKLSKTCHQKIQDGIDITDLEEDIDELAAELWELSNEDLKDIKDSLEELK